MSAVTGRVVAKGTRLWAQGLAEGSFTKVAAIISVPGPTFTRDDIDATEIDQVPATLPGGAIEDEYYWKNQLPGTKSVEPFTCECNYTRAGYARVKSFFDKDAIVSWKIVLKNGDIVGPFDGYVKALGGPVSAGDSSLVKAPLTIQPTDLIGAITAGS